MGPLPSLRHIQISQLPLRVDSKAIILPSGENCGPLSNLDEEISLSEKPAGTDELSVLLQMLIFATWREYTNRFPRIEGCTPSWPNSSRSGLPPLRDIFQSQPAFAR